jgi:hypothetical protein
MWRLSHLLCSPIAGLVLALSGYASPPTDFKPLAPHGAEAKRDQLTGRWYGNMRTKDGGTRRWLTERRLDGTYTIEFVVVERDGSVLRQTEFGDWGVSGNYFVTVTRGVQDSGGDITPDKQSSYFWDVYKIVRLGSKQFVYQNVATGNKFIVRRVDASFAIPNT